MSFLDYVRRFLLGKSSRRDFELLSLNLKAVIAGYAAGMPILAETALANLENEQNVRDPRGKMVRSIVQGQFRYLDAPHVFKNLAETIGDLVFADLEMPLPGKAMLLKSFPIAHPPGALRLLMQEVALLVELLAGLGCDLSPGDAATLLIGISNAWALDQEKNTRSLDGYALRQLAHERAAQWLQMPGSLSMSPLAARTFWHFAMGGVSNGRRYIGGDGRSGKSPVVVNTIHPLRGVAAEYAWLSERFGEAGVEWHEVNRTHKWHNGKYYERFTVALLKEGGREQAVFFDVTAFQASDPDPVGR